MLVYISWSNYTLTTIRCFLQLYVLIYVATIRSFSGAYTHFKNLRIVALRRCIVATYSDAKNTYMCKWGSVYVAYSKIRSPDGSCALLSLMPSSDECACSVHAWAFRSSTMLCRLTATIVFTPHDITWLSEEFISFQHFNVESLVVWTTSWCDTVGSELISYLAPPEIRRVLVVWRAH